MHNPAAEELGLSLLASAQAEDVAVVDHLQLFARFCELCLGANDEKVVDVRDDPKSLRTVYVYTRCRSRVLKTKFGHHPAHQPLPNGWCFSGPVHGLSQDPDTPTILLTRVFFRQMNEDLEFRIAM